MERSVNYNFFLKLLQQHLIKLAQIFKRDYLTQKIEEMIDEAYETANKTPPADESV